MSNNLEPKSIRFWPVGNGDSTTIAVRDELVLQVDLNHMKSAEDEEDPRTGIIDKLSEILPQKNKKPYIATFALTHPDQDHCRGFAQLIKEFHIGELWHTPRVFREFKKDLCDDAKAFKKESERRTKLMIEKKGNVDSGDRLRLIGYDELLNEDEYKDFPKEYLTTPGKTISELDGISTEGEFLVFIHAPFKDDAEEDRNDTSLAFQGTFLNGELKLQFLLLGDHCYPTLNRIFTKSQAEDLAWNLMLSPHHCSKSAMYWKDEGEEEESLKKEILTKMEGAEQSPGYIISSSDPIPKSNSDGDNPPHAIAKNRYQEIVSDDFICTQEHPNKDTPEAVVFQLTDNGVEYIPPKGDKKASEIANASLLAAVKEARGGEAPKEKIGFGSI